MKTFTKFRQDIAEALEPNQSIDSLFEDELEEDAPTNNAGSGNIAGLGVGPQGEPGVSPNYQRKRKQLKLMNGPAVDPRLFRDAIFRRKP